MKDLKKTKKQAKIIDKFMMYSTNYTLSTYVLGDKEIYAPSCFKNTTCPEHLASKFNGYLSNFSGTHSFYKLWYQLDDNNKSLVCEWINENYKG
jgi:hypothetical protein